MHLDRTTKRPATAVTLGRLLLAAASATGGCVGTAAAADAPTGVQVLQARAVASVPGGTSGLGHLTLKNGGKADDRLLSAASPVAERVEVHEMTMQGDVMKMRQLPQLAIPAGHTVQFDDDGLHLMFLGLRRPLLAGQTFPLTLRFEHAGSVQTQVQVQSRDAGGKAALPAKPGHGH